MSGLLIVLDFRRLFDVFVDSIWSTFTVNGVCMVFIVSQRKAHSTLHPGRARRGLHLVLSGVIVASFCFAAKYFKACFGDINVAYI